MAIPLLPEPEPVVAVPARPAPAVIDAVGRARVDRRTKRLLERVQPGEVAVIDHRDLDRMAAAGLVAAGVVAVVNAAASISGRYPNEGPLLVAQAGIPLIDEVGPDALDRIGEGDPVAVIGDDVWVGDQLVAHGVRQSAPALTEQILAARRRLGAELEQFATNT